MKKQTKNTEKLKSQDQKNKKQIQINNIKIIYLKITIKTV